MKFNFDREVPRHLSVKPHDDQNATPQRFCAIRHFYSPDTSAISDANAVEARTEYFNNKALCFSYNGKFFVYLENSGLTAFVGRKESRFRVACISNGDEILTFNFIGQVADRVTIREIRSIELRVIEGGRVIHCFASSLDTAEVTILETKLYKWYEFVDPTVPDPNDLDLAVLTLQSILQRLVAPSRIALKTIYQ